MQLRRNNNLPILIVIIALCSCSPDNRKILFEDMNKIAQQGNPEAQYHVGMMFNNGIGVQKDPKKAFEWFEKASASGHPLASYKVGCYFGGQFKDVVPFDQDRSLEYKLVAAKAGYSLAQHDVGTIFARQNKLAEAVHWWELAARQGYPTALYNLSVCYKEGKGVPQHNAFAYAYFKLAKLASEGSVNEKAQATLDELKRTMSAVEIEKAEQFVSSWKTESTSLTKKASAGLDEARRFLSAGKQS